MPRKKKTKIIEDNSEKIINENVDEIAKKDEDAIAGVTVNKDEDEIADVTVKKDDDEISNEIANKITDELAKEPTDPDDLLKDIQDTISKDVKDIRQRIKEEKKQEDHVEISRDTAKGYIIEMMDICKYYEMGDEVVRANDGINLNVERGEFLSIVGKSGSGKSTLMNIIGALDVPTSGKYLLGGEDVGKMNDNQLADIRNRMIGFVFQQYNLLPKLTVQENVELPLLYARLNRKERSERALEALKKVGLESKRANMPNQLSGGQQQRVSIARALAGSPSILLADEPTGALDSRTSRQILEFFRQLNEEGNTVIMITHDNSIALQARRVARITDGKIDFDGKAEDYERII